jgi:transposase-like protein
VFGFAPSTVTTFSTCLGALVGAATVPTRQLRPAPGEPGRRHGADAQPCGYLHSGRIWLLGRANTSWPLPRRPVIDHARAPYRNNTAMIGIVDLQRAEADLAAGELACPGCGGELHRWGHARARDIRDSESTTLTLRPRRARCSSCGSTHVLLLGAVLPRRADTTAMIVTALQASARGIGYRRIAAQLGRPASTVRRWSGRSAMTTTLSGCVSRASGGSPDSTVRS